MKNLRITRNLLEVPVTIKFLHSVPFSFNLHFDYPYPKMNLVKVKRKWTEMKPPDVFLT